ncbi:TetR/AcrR family transcriptional regulator [Novosphingobium sp. 9U]|uniref:TetR/AcrR family transcriptional regulator n=1 Tax=Novosphingobium sp. 9U TaxID=2653158 RepID=UPI0012F2EAE6|nr:TetR/AcrR family transcriptional regulator [Novosphingobium sp. 9U]VWX54519.1 DNA-binding transcriptional regulator, AcrR family [Novosphingobium sp. 9U]
MSREAILDAAEAILRDEGYAAVSSRKVAAVAGLKSKLVHYYFKTMDELFLALLRRVEEQHFAELRKATASGEPLRALWHLSTDPTVPKLHKEFVALATHHEQLRQEIARSAQRTRQVYAAAAESALIVAGLSTSMFPPVAIGMMLDGISRVLSTDKILGLDSGHADAIALVETLLNRLSVSRCEETTDAQQQI